MLGGLVHQAIGGLQVFGNALECRTVGVGMLGRHECRIAFGIQGVGQIHKGVFDTVQRVAKAAQAGINTLVGGALTLLLVELLLLLLPLLLQLVNALLQLLVCQCQAVIFGALLLQLCFELCKNMGNPLQLSGGRFVTRWLQSARGDVAVVTGMQMALWHDRGIISY